MLTELGAKPTLARFALADGVKPEKDAVAAWLQENGSDFGWTPAEQEPATATAPAQPAAVQQAAPSVDPAVVAALQQILGAQSSGSPAALADLEAKVSAASSQEELLTLIQNS